MHDSFLSLLDTVGACFAFLSTIYLIRAQVFAWPLGLIAIVGDMVLCFKTGIYGDMVLNGIYFISTFYGWYQWKRGGEQKKELPITHVTQKQLLLLILIFIAGTFVLAESLTHFAHSQVPYLDAITTVLSLISQWLICKKIIECWIGWFIVDSLYVGLYFYKNLPAHSILLIIYVGMAVIGYWRWWRLSSTKSINSSQMFKLKSASS